MFPAAAGVHASCPDRYHGRAFVNNVEWDISALSQCEQGVGCPVSKTFTDPFFMVPDGCSSIQMTATAAGGRGVVNSFPPTRASAFRGELEISDASSQAICRCLATVWAYFDRLLVISGRIRRG